MSANTAQMPAAKVAPMIVELLALDLETCSRCVGTEANLAAALAETSRRLETTGIDVELRRTVVASEAEAHALHLQSSPTIRIDGKDIALEFRESPCEADACACHGGIDCRVWVWQGQEYNEAPRQMIVDAILGAVAGDRASTAASSGHVAEVPGNLRRFYAAKTGAPTPGEACCWPVEADACCEPDTKAACCDGHPDGSCGCR